MDMNEPGNIQRIGDGLGQGPGQAARQQFTTARQRISCLSLLFCLAAKINRYEAVVVLNPDVFFTPDPVQAFENHGSVINL